MNEASLAKKVEAFFRETGEAHHQAVAETGGADPEWPMWYAEYRRERRTTLLKAGLTKSELIHLLVAAGKEVWRAPGADWARYYAGFFVERYA